MYEVTIEDEFAAAHRLDHYEGNCEHLHGHNWKIQVSYTASKLDEAGIALDFRKAKSMLRQVLGLLDHTYLNDLTAFSTGNPSCENIAGFIYGEIERLLHHNNDKPDVRISSVTVWESARSWVRYFREKTSD